MYEELINRLKRYSEACVAYKLDADFAYAVQEAIEVISKKEKTTQWIPVTERLPREQEAVLTWGKQGAVLLDWRHDNKWCCFGGVTHWMPLPEPPKEGEG